jgi:ketosteroid isomerase-like protein
MTNAMTRTLAVDAKVEPLEAVERLYRAFDDRDTETVFACFAEDIVIRQSTDLPWGGTWRGPEGAAAFFAALTSHIETRVRIERMIEAGDTIVEIGWTEGRAIATNRTFSIPETHVFEVVDSRIRSMTAYVDNRQMLEAIGVRPPSPVR